MKKEAEKLGRLMKAHKGVSAYYLLILTPTLWCAVQTAHSIVRPAPKQPAPTNAPIATTQFEPSNAVTATIHFASSNIATATVHLGTWRATTTTQPGQSSDKPAAATSLDIYGLAVLLTGFLYFLSKWVTDIVLKQPEKDALKGALLVCWIALLGSAIACLIGVLAFGIQGCRTAVGVITSQGWGWCHWFLALAAVGVIALVHVAMAAGLLRWFFCKLIGGSAPSSSDFEHGELVNNWLLPGKWYIVFAIPLFIALGVVCTCWHVQAEIAKSSAPRDLVLSLIFGLYGVGVYAAGTDYYLPRVKKWL